MSARLEDWSLVVMPGDWAGTPELATQHLSGIVTGHPKKEDGKRITTGPIVSSDDNVILTLSGTRYELGEPAKEYEAAYPGAKERVFAALRAKAVQV